MIVYDRRMNFSFTTFLPSIHLVFLFPSLTFLLLLLSITYFLLRLPHAPPSCSASISPARSSTVRDPLWTPDCPTSPPPSYAASVASDSCATPTPQDLQQPKYSSEIFIPAKSSSSSSSAMSKEYSRKDSVPLSKNVIMEEKG